MRKPFTYCSLGVVVLATLGALLGSRMSERPARVNGSFAAYDSSPARNGVTMIYPVSGTIFPSEALPPKFRWSTAVAGIDTWFVRVLSSDAEPVEIAVSRTEWTPDAEVWKRLKLGSVTHPARVNVFGVAKAAPDKVLASGSLAITTSTDVVGAPIFYREVVLPFIEAVKSPERIRWRFGTIDALPQPPVVLENLPVCGNCHSFSSDGTVLGMDVDYANDKGSYVLTETSREIALSKRKVITWSDFRRDDKQPTFGLLSQVSPDGRYAVSTVKDRSVFVPKADLEYSQLFFPLKGILAYYDRRNRTFAALPGADDPKYVHSNPTFSPDGQYIVFARAKAYELERLKDSGTALLTQQECREFLEEGKTFRFDLYRIPFNDGRGGEAVPLVGASGNGRSNFFARYSPDGKWIVFCQANSFMLLQPDSELYVVPAEGGVARRLDCNTNRMNSWHSWSPNGKWLVFSSKAHSPYTQLFLAHMDEQGQCAPAMVLDQFTAADRAANIPEFVNLGPDAITRIREEFVDDESYMRTALENIKAEDPVAAEKLYRKALSLNPENAEAHAFLAGILVDRGQLVDARNQLTEALRLDPKSSIAHYNLGNLQAKEHRYDEAVESWKKALALDPHNGKARQNIAAVLLDRGRAEDAAEFLRASMAQDRADPQAHLALGNVLSKLGRRKAAVEQWQTALELDPSLVDAQVNLGVDAMESGDAERAIGYFEQALHTDPNNVACLMNLGAAYSKQGAFSNADQVTRRAAKLAKAGAQQDLFAECQRRLARYEELSRANAREVSPH